MVIHPYDPIKGSFKETHNSYRDLTSNHPRIQLTSLEFTRNMKLCKHWSIQST